MKRFLAPVAAAPLCFAALTDLHADTTMSGSSSTGVLTSNTGDLIISGTLSPGSGTAVTVDSNNALSVSGTVSITGNSNTTGILLEGGNSGTIGVSGTLTLTDTDVSSTIPLTTAENRYGIWASGTGAFTGDISVSGTLTVRGNDSAGILLATEVDGSTTVSGTVSVTGNNSYGVHTTAVTAGTMTISGSISMLGTGSVGVALDGVTQGAVDVTGSITSTGYLSTTRPTTTAGFEALTANDELQGGAAISISQTVTGGLYIESTAVVSSYGSAPSIVIGGTSGTLEMGAYPGDTRGLLLAGAIVSSGVYNGFSTTGVQIGGLGGDVLVDGGLSLSGSITTLSYQAASTGILIGSGATVTDIAVSGGLSSTVISQNSQATAISIAAGATVNSLNVVGSVAAYVGGYGGSVSAVTGNAVAVYDASGTLSLVNNSGTILAKVSLGDDNTAVTGEAIALDLRANTTGVTINNSGTITGDILLGSGDATVNLTAGTVTGALAYGSGDNTLTIDSGATYYGALTSEGTLTATISGKLRDTSASAISMKSLTVGSTGEIDFTADPANGTNTVFNVAGTATIDSGAKIGLIFKSKVTDTTTFTVIKASSLNVGAVDQSLLGDVSYWYKANIATDTTAGTVSINVARRTAAEAGITVGASAFNAIYGAFDKDTEISDAFFNATTQNSFGSLYEKMLPDYNGGPFQLLNRGMMALSRTEGDPSVAMRDEQRGAWVQELGFAVSQNRNQGPGYNGNGVALMGGYEKSVQNVGIVGLATSYMITAVNDPDSSSSNQVKGEVFTGGAYWRDRLGGLLANASVNAGYIRFSSTRAFDGTDSDDVAFERQASAHWSGYMGDAHVGLGYEQSLGFMFVRPNASLDYFLLYDGAHQESGGGDALDLNINSRTGQQGNAEASLTFGTQFGGDFQWKPALTVGWKQVFGDGPGDTVANFAGGSSFTLVPDSMVGGGPIARLTISGGNRYSDIGLELGGEDRHGFIGYDARFVSKFRF
ncbi:MAG: autotransporter domain-containing protein [Azospirillaceae bacterium]|nr:autotransporter domain-containing protein [Azospirillaceae bacterium]